MPRGRRQGPEGELLIMKTTTRRIRGALSVVALVAGMLGVGATPAQAAIFNVTSTDATYDGVCDDHCTLWDAVYVANGLPGEHTVFVPSGEYTATSGPLTIWSNLTLQAVGGQVTLDAKRTGRVLKVNPEGNATLKGFLITNGKAADGGAGILNDGTLTLIDSVVNASTSSGCGGGLLNHGTAHLSRSQVDVNKAASGGGICNSTFATLTLTNTGVGFNQSTGGSSGPDGGAGIWNRGRADILGSRVGGNTVLGGLLAAGGGIYSDGNLTVSDTLVAQNRASGDGGGIFNADTAKIIDTRIVDNTAGAGGGIDHHGGTMQLQRSTVRGNTAFFGGGISNQATLDVRTSTVSGNTARIYHGGGLTNVGNAQASIANSTITGNTAGGDGGGIQQTANYRLTITSSTIVRNVANDDNANGGRGGGIAVSNAGASLRNTILAANENPGHLGSSDCFGLLTSTGYNIVGDDPDTCFATIPTTDSSGIPKLGPLANNGGPTRTHALTGSRGAIDHGPTGASCSGRDQRGAPRTSPCDTGAYELVECGSVSVTVVGSDGRDVIKGTGRADGILALGGADRVQGGAGNDQICGGGGADELSGARGNDHLFGGPGRDRCSGGSGRNTYQRCERRGTDASRSTSGEWPAQ